VGGPKHVEFIVVAGTQSELERDRARECLASYGATLHEWCPYHRGDDHRVALLVQRIAQRKKLTSGIHPATQDLVARVSDALGRNVPVVLVVDIWTLRLATYRSYMELFDDAHRLVNAGVLVVWDLDDNERKHEHDLDAVLRQAFPTLTTTRDRPAFHHRLDTQKDLIRRLHATLATLRTRIMVFGEVKRRAEGDRRIPKPVLEQRGDPASHDALLHPLTKAEPGAT
jgi:FxsC-like protein